MDPERMRRRIEEIAPQAVVGATIYGSFALAQTRPGVPFWADQFGQVMAEAQAKAALDRENWPLAHFWRMLGPVVRRADKISAVSERQRYAVIGELGALGRLNAETCGYELTAVLPCALIPQEPLPSRGLLRPGRVPQDAFLTLWSGGYNVWSDVETLFRGVEAAMRRDDRVWFVSTGGAIDGHDEATYRHFEELVAGSDLAHRFLLEGWLRADQVPFYVAEADLGVLTERTMYEGVLGSKNRIIQWMGVGLPTAYNRVGDLGDLLAEQSLGLTFPVGDAEALAERILWAAGHPRELAEMARRAREHTESHLTFDATTVELARWCAEPRRAPDAELREGIRSPADYATTQQRIVDQARKIPQVRRSERLVAVWRRMRGEG
jgi:glycosyltransferase involved in cell wall biosynthesis